MLYDEFYGDIDAFSGATDAVETYGANAGEGLLTTIMMVYLLILGAILIGKIIDLFFRGFGLYKIGKAQGKTNCWLAFVPFARVYFQGELGGPIQFRTKTMKSPGLWLVIVPLISGGLSGVGYVLFLIFSMVGSFVSSSEAAMYNVATGMVSGLLIFTFIAIIFSIIYQAFIHVLYVLVNYQIYEKYTTRTMAIVHAVLGTLVPLYQGIYMFLIGRRVEQMYDVEEQQE